MSPVTPGPHLLNPELLVRAYAAGVFPMSESRHDPSIFWVDPEIRGILPLQSFHVSRSLKKTIKGRLFNVAFDSDFAAVIAACAETPRPDQGTWINDQIIEAYTELHHLGVAHSVECRLDGKLVGGLYGVSLNGAFCGESMFSHATDASKVALVHLVARLKLCKMQLLDTQFVTDHLKGFGAIEIPAREYLTLLEQALESEAKFHCDVSDDESWSSVKAVLAQSSTQTS
ncbi:MAG: leucyl/phenylalanyl-tRNA--protein transferase [Rhodospirillales bacterium]|nr:leucyl/phenylalanyl-tRNA--protein transferase [Rhodospirillales bacterium]